jgi:hypothetical protein
MEAALTGLDGPSMGLGDLWRLPNAQSRSISAENFTGEKGKAGIATEGTGASCARDLGRGWKVSPSAAIRAGETFTLADIRGPGVIQSMWITGSCAVKQPRLSILRIYWDGQECPSVECPLGDFFASGWGGYAQISSLPVAVNPGRGFNCFWPMPFRKGCRITLQNLSDEETIAYYQINYALTDVPEDAAYFHAQFRRINPRVRYRVLRAL